MTTIKKSDRPPRYGGEKADSPHSEEVANHRKQRLRNSIQLNFPLRDKKRAEIRELAGILARVGQTISIMSNDIPTLSDLQHAAEKELNEAQRRMLKYRRLDLNWGNARFKGPISPWNRQKETDFDRRLRSVIQREMVEKLTYQIPPKRE